jgi:hypothetical protein
VPRQLAKLVAPLCHRGRQSSLGANRPSLNKGDKQAVQRRVPPPASPPPQVFSICRARRATRPQRAAKQSSSPMTPPAEKE